MDELGAQLGAVLNDPQQMARIMGLAQSLIGGGGAETAPPPPQSAGLAALLKGAGPGPADDRQALLRALRPYLSEKRQRKLERAMHLTRMAQLAKTALGTLGGEEHA